MDSCNIGFRFGQNRFSILVMQAGHISNISRIPGGQSRRVSNISRFKGSQNGSFQILPGSRCLRLARSPMCSKLPGFQNEFKTYVFVKAEFN